MKIALLGLLILSRLVAEELKVEAFWVNEERAQEEGFALVRGDSLSPPFTAKQASVSRFFREGDSVVDLTQHFIDLGFAFSNGWVRYNESSNFLVAKAPPKTLGELQVRYEVGRTQPINCGLNLEVFALPVVKAGFVDYSENWGAVEKNSLLALNTVSKGGEVVTQSFRTESGTMSEVEASVGVDLLNQIMNVQLHFKLKEEESELEWRASLELVNGSDSFYELGSVSGDEAMVVRVKPELFVVGGPSLLNCHQLEEKLAPPKVELDLGRQLEELKSEGGVRIHQLAFFPNEILDLVGEPLAADDDPFMAVDSVREFSMLELERVEEPPPFLQKLFPREVWYDVTADYEEAGIQFAEGDYAYYGRVANRMVWCLSDNEGWEMIEQIHAGLCGGQSPAVSVTLSLVRRNDEEETVLAKSEVTNLSGQSGHVILREGDSLVDCEALATLGVEGLLDVRVAPVFKGDFGMEMNTGLSLKAGISHEVVLSRAGRETILLQVEVNQRWY